MDLNSPYQAKSYFLGESSEQLFWIMNRAVVMSSMQQQGRFSLLGLGDIIMPGLVLCFVLRFESRKRVNNLYNNNPLLFINRLSYFQCCLLGYCAGTKIFSSISYSSSSIPFRLIDSYHFIGSVQMCSTSTSLSRSIYSHTLIMHRPFKGKYPHLN